MGVLFKIRWAWKWEAGTDEFEVWRANFAFHAQTLGVLFRWGANYFDRYMASFWWVIQGTHFSRALQLRSRTSPFLLIRDKLPDLQQPPWCSSMLLNFGVVTVYRLYKSFFDELVGFMFVLPCYPARDPTGIFTASLRHCCAEVSPGPHFFARHVSAGN